MDDVTGQGHEAGSDQVDMLDLILLLVENWRVLLAIPLLGGIVALGIAFLVPPTYTATARVLPPVQQSTSVALAAQLGPLAGLVGNVGGLKNPADQFVALLKSRTVSDAIIERFKLKEVYETAYLDDTRRELEKRARALAGLRDGIISIEVDDNDPHRAAAMANGFVDELRNLTNRLAITEAAQRRLFFEDQLAQAKNNLAKAETALQGSGVSEATLRTVPQSALESLARLKAQITAQEIKLASMRMYMTDTNPDLKLGIQELAALRSELAKVEQSSSSKAAGNGTEYVAKYRDFKYHETLFELMAKQYELARLDETREGAIVQVIDEAVAPQRSAKPKKAKVALLAVISLFFVTLLFVFVRQTFARMATLPESAGKLDRLRQLTRLRR